jgi:hypothetical protein
LIGGGGVGAGFGAGVGGYKKKMYIVDETTLYLFTTI